MKTKNQEDKLENQEEELKKEIERREKWVEQRYSKEPENIPCMKDEDNELMRLKAKLEGFELGQNSKEHYLNKLADKLKEDMKDTDGWEFNHNSFINFIDKILKEILEEGK